MQDLHNNIHPSGVAVTAETDNTATVSGIIDRQGYNSLEFLIATGVLADADATFVVLVEEGDDSGLSDAANVADADLLGTEVLAAFTFADDGEARKIGYNGNKRYTRCTVTPSANASAAPIAIIPLLGHPNSAPTANPPE
jgi:hypothetical protein